MKNQEFKVGTYILSRGPSGNFIIKAGSHKYAGKLVLRRDAAAKIANWLRLELSNDNNELINYKV